MWQLFISVTTSTSTSQKSKFKKINRICYILVDYAVFCTVSINFNFALSASL